MNSTLTQHFIPTINGTATTNKEKITQFTQTLLPSSPPLTDTSDITNENTYPEPIPGNTTTTKQQVERAIGKLAPNKAPGPDEITNRVLKETSGILQEHIPILAQANIDARHYPAAFRNTLMIL